MFSSMISLIYAGYAESKSWLVVYTTGSFFYFEYAEILLNSQIPDTYVSKNKMC